MLIKSSLLFLSLALLSFSGCSQQEPHLGETITARDGGDGISVIEADSRTLLPSGKIAGSDSTLLQVESVVQLIDYKNRLLTVKPENGEPIDLIVGPEVRNFRQIQAGDRVKVQYLVSVAFEVRKPTDQELAAAGEAVGVAGRAKLGQMPAGGAAAAGITVANIQAIDKRAQTITLKSVRSGETTVVKAKYPENLNYAKVGDSVVIKVVEAFATSVERAR